MEKPFLTRKEVASYLHLHPDTVARHEKNLGLLPCKVIVSSRLIMYRAHDAMRALSPSVADSKEQKPTV